MPTGLLGERGTVNPAGFCTLTRAGRVMCANSANFSTWYVIVRASPGLTDGGHATMTYRAAG
jgi:hypothetical protein